MSHANARIVQRLYDKRIEHWPEAQRLDDPNHEHQAEWDNAYSLVFVDVVHTLSERLDIPSIQLHSEYFNYRGTSYA